MASKHLHIVGRNGSDLPGDGRRLSPADVKAAFDGTPYGDLPGLKALIAGKIDGGYTTSPDGGGWVAVFTCTGTSTDECAVTLTGVTIGGHIRYAKQAGAL